MQHRSAALLWDLATAARRIQGFVAGKSWDDYSDDLLLRLLVDQNLPLTLAMRSMPPYASRIAWSRSMNAPAQPRTCCAAR